ncbi:MAG TPA: ABC transporter substrate-binding protein [Beijerinckiaceae bacterium]|nr:ABC transporter substrate-binding protein [Beijerinckiaceae bacterium]
MKVTVLAAAALASAAVYALPVLAQTRDSVTLCMTLEPPILDPTQGAAQAIKEVTYGNLFEGLVALTSGGKIVAKLAESWTVSPDNLTYTFKLRQGVKFHDGADLTSADVKFSFERAVAPDSKNATKKVFAPIASIETPDPLTVVLKLKEVSANLLFGLTFGDASILSPASAKDAATRPVGTGAYKYVDWSRGNRLQYTRNDSWWGGKAAIRDVTYRFIADPQAQLAAIQAGDCDALTNFGASESIEILKKNPGLKVAFGNTEGETILAMNNLKPPFNDLRVRRAIAHAIDRKTVIDGTMNGVATPIGTHFSPNHPAYVDLTGVTPYDPKKAKALLAEAGFPNGFSTTLKLPPPPYARRSGEIVAAMLGEVGIKVSIEPIEFPQWLERVYRNKDYDLSIIAHTEPLDIEIYSRPDYYFQYNNADMQKLVKAAESTADEAARNELYRQAQKKIVDDQVNVYLFMLPKTTVSKVGLNGMWENWPIPVSPAHELSWK